MPVVPAITGIGLVTPLGHSAAQTWHALLAGQSIRDHARLKPNVATDLPRVTSLAIEAAREAVAYACWSDRPQTSQSALVVGTSKGPIEAWLNPPSTSDKPSTRANSCVKPAMASPVFGLATIASALAQHLGLGDGAQLTLSAACASGLHALIRGAMMIRAGEATRVLVVAAEASVHPLFLGSFRRLGVLPPEGVPCRPFDQNRQGFLMSEAAAAVCLEAMDVEDPTKPRICIRGSAPREKCIAVIDRFAQAGDAAHLTAGDPTGAVLQRTLGRVIDGKPFDLIHAHGTGTPFNDPIELAAIEAVLPADQAPATLYSHKGAIGHSLGAAGLVSVVLNCMAHTGGVIPPNINTLDPLPSRRCVIAREPRQHAVRRSLACASGFGGPLAAISLISR